MNDMPFHFWPDLDTFVLIPSMPLLPTAGGVRLGPVQVRRQDGLRLPGPPAGGGGDEASASTASHGGGDEASEGSPRRRQLPALGQLRDVQLRRDRARGQAAAAGRGVGRAVRNRKVDRS